ncbi:DUF2735 domain-containing protein [Mesorhizobium sp. BAC0120]|uniref:DUF2735 domain-containing protein n=1 Tax=Mesorhizobium sp. BAC0120 TaxID=3090670 RepID=UPI00298CCCA1|nr:DUF2735 domain-containing protein [Mesorhizobium sp. BAC0120]MDW6023124.1 DUF2735 domain-containing protein [Mesorhizobium sp. BAC0120]
MSTTVRHESAKIYTFPKRAKTKVEKYSSHSDQANSPVSLGSRRAANIASEGGWYHEAAIEEAKRDRNQ